MCSHTRQVSKAGHWYCKLCGAKIPNKEPVDWSDGRAPSVSCSDEKKFVDSVFECAGQNMETLEKRKKRDRDEFKRKVMEGKSLAEHIHEERKIEVV